MGYNKNMKKVNRKALFFLLFSFVLSIVLVGRVNAVIEPPSGGGVISDFSFSSSSLDFGTVTVGQTKTRNIVLRYNGSSFSVVSSVSFTGPFECVSGCSFNLKEGESQSISIVFSPASVGAVSGKIIARTENYQASADLLGTASPQGAQPPLECTSDPVWGEDSYLACFWNNKELSGTSEREMLAFDAPLEADWGNGRPISEATTYNNFSARFLGRFTFDAGMYNFIVRGDDGVRVYVDGIRVFDHWGEGGGWEDESGPVSIVGGRHDISVEYQDYDNNAYVGVLWKNVGPPPGGDTGGTTPQPLGNLTNEEIEDRFGSGVDIEGVRKLIEQGWTETKIRNFLASLRGGEEFSSGGIIQIRNPLKTDTLAELIDTLINLIFTISLAIAPVIVLYAGFLFVTATGRPEQITRARNILLWTVIGFAVILLARGLITILEDILEVR